MYTQKDRDQHLFERGKIQEFCEEKASEWAVNQGPDFGFTGSVYVRWDFHVHVWQCQVIARQGFCKHETNIEHKAVSVPQESIWDNCDD